MADVPLLAIEDVSAFYGTAQALEDVSFTLAGGATSIVGRNGMGKTTLCNAIVGMPPARVTGSIRYQGKELVGSPSYRIAKLGIGYVPQGRRLFPSLSVDEHLRWSAGAAAKRWTLRPRLRALPAPRTSGAGTAARSSRAASSRCSRSAARSSRTRRC